MSERAAALAAPRSAGFDASGRAQAAQGKGFLWWMLVLYLVLEYARPPLLVVLRLQMLTILVLPVLWIFAHDRVWSRVLTAQAALLVVCGSMVLFAHNNYSAYFQTRLVYGNFVISAAMPWILNDRRRYVRLVWVWLGIMAYLGYYGILHGGRGPGGFIGDENDLALALLTALPLAFFGFENQKGAVRWASLAIAVVLVAGVVSSFSRGAFVGLVAAGAYCYVSARHKIRNLLVLLLAAGAFWAAAPQSYIDEMRTIQDTDEGTADARYFLWTTAYNMWKDHRLLGVGAGNFNYLAGRYQPDWEGPEYQYRDWSGTTTHSLYFQMLSELGIAGVGAFLFLLHAHFGLLRRLRRDVRRLPDLPPDLRRDAETYAGGLAGGMVGYLVAGAFLSVAYYPYAFYLSGLAVALDACVRREIAAAAARGSPGTASE